MAQGARGECHSGGRLSFSLLRSISSDSIYGGHFYYFIQIPFTTSAPLHPHTRFCEWWLLTSHSRSFFRALFPIDKSHLAVEFMFSQQFTNRDWLKMGYKMFVPSPQKRNQLCGMTHMPGLPMESS